jgi:hypothetical protein
MLDGKKTYIVSALIALAAVFSYFGTVTQNEFYAAALLGMAGVAVSLRKALEAKK